MRYRVGGHGGLGANGRSACEGEAGAAQNRRGAPGLGHQLLPGCRAVSGQLDKRPALEYLVGIDRHTGAYIPELAEKWDMAPDGKTWTITLRKGVKFHEHWGEFTARDVRHAVFLITQPESVQSDASFWRTVMGVTKTDTVRGGGQESRTGRGDRRRLQGRVPPQAGGAGVCREHLAPTPTW